MFFINRERQEDRDCNRNVWKLIGCAQTHTLKASFGMGWLLGPRLTSPGPLLGNWPWGISQLSHYNPNQGLRDGGSSFPSSSTSLCFPSWLLGAWRTSHRGACIAGEWNGNKAYGEERDEGKGITAIGEGGLRRAALLFLHQRLLLE